MKKFLLIFIFLPFTSKSQFRIIVDPTYEPKIRTAVELIKETDAGAFCLLTDYCTQIRISNDTLPKMFSDNLINIPLRLVAQPSFNNISSWLVRQSYGLRLNDVNPNIDPKLKMDLMLKYEINFTKKLPREYGTSFKERMRKLFDKLTNEPYEQSEKIPDYPLPENPNGN